MTARIAALPLLALVLALGGCTRADPLECPQPQLHRADGTLYDTRDDIIAEGERFAGIVSQNAVAEAVTALRARYPGASDAEVYNYLVAAYCPVARQTADGADHQAARLARFEQVLDIFLNP